MKIHVVRKLRVVLFVLFCGTGLFAEQIITADIDGELIDSSKDGIFDTVNANAMQFRVLDSSRSRVAAVMEFSIPAKASPAKTAFLRLWLNGNSGTTAWPETGECFGPDCSLFAYLPPDADGKLTLSDDGCGEKIARVLAARPVSVKEPVRIDVTAFYNRAVREKCRRIGFRIEADEKQPGPQNGWRFRTLKFSAKFSKKWAPSLVVANSNMEYAE